MSSLAKEKKLNVSSNNSKSRVAAYVELTKLRISVMVLITFVVAALIATGGVINDWASFVMAIIGMLAIAASGNSLNMYIERYSDFYMNRTAKRPLPNQRLSASEVALFGAITFGIGLGFLLSVNLPIAICGLANWILYVFVYTPLKRTTWLNTEVGAVAGAMPIVMGSLATTGTIGFTNLIFFTVLLLWQFPHFMAIAWIYKDDYARGGLKMLTVVDPTGKRAGRKAVFTAVLIVIIGVLPAMMMRTPVHTWVFAVIVTLLAMVYLKASMQFSKSLDEPSARKLLRVSLLYLPLYMFTLAIASLT